MSRPEDRPTDAGAEGVCRTWHRHDARVDSIVGMNRQITHRLCWGGMQRRRADMIQCIFRSRKRVLVTRNTTHRHTSTHARVGALGPGKDTTVHQNPHSGEAVGGSEHDTNLC